MATQTMTENPTSLMATGEFNEKYDAPRDEVHPGVNQHDGNFTAETSEKSQGHVDASFHSVSEDSEPMKWGGLDPAYQPKEIKKIVREAILLSGGGVAVLLQMAHPSVAAGVNNHSNFAYRPVDRLRTTMTYVYCMTFGTPAEKEAIINLVHKAHTVVKGKDGGRDYSADDPDLQLWVAATLYATAINLYTKIFGSLPEKEHDKIYTQYAILATSLRVPQKLWPANRAAFWRYWDEQIAKAEINDHARAVAQDVLWNKVAPLWVRAPLPLLRVFTTYMLPPTLREEFGFKDTKSRRAFYNLMVGTLKVTYPLTPKFIRTYPKKYYMNDMRKRLTKMGHVI